MTGWRMTGWSSRTIGALALALTAGVATAPGAGAGVVAAEAQTAPPGTFVALTDPDAGPSAVAVFSTRTGQLLRRLTPPAPGGGPSEPLVTRSGRAAVYSAGAGSCAADVMRVALDGGSAPELLVRGTGGPALSPALAPGGRRIAYVQAHCEHGDTELVVRRLRSDAPPLVLHSAAGGATLHQPRWSADGWLAYRSTGEPAGLHTVPARAGGSIRSADAPAGCAWGAADWFTDAAGRQRLLVSADCPGGARWLLLNRELRTLRTLVQLPHQRGAQAVSVDASGSHAVYQEQGASVPGPVWRWELSPGSAPVRVAQGPATPSWR